MKKLLLVPVLAALVSPLAALADSNVITSAGAQAKANANLDFKITVPRLLSLQIGTANSVDLLEFQVPASGIGNNTPVSATGGDQANGAVTVRVLANGANTVQLNSKTSGALNNGSGGGTIGWDQIAVAEATLPAQTSGYSNAVITHPAFNTNAASGGDGTVTNLDATNGLVRREAKWTYSYKNQNVVAAGTYGGVNTQNGRVTYTATMP